MSLEARVPAAHPLRVIRAVVDEALDVLSPRLEELYARTGRPSVPPEKPIRALLVQAFFSIRSERQLMQQLDDNLLFRWFVGLSMDAPVWDATTFGKNRDRLLDASVTLGAERGYDTRDFVEALTQRGIAPHIARDTHATKTGRHRFSAVPQALTLAWGYLASQRIRKRIEEPFGWVKSVAGLRQTRHRGLARVSAAFSLAVTAYNLVRLPKLLAAPA